MSDSDQMDDQRKHPQEPAEGPPPGPQEEPEPRVRPQAPAEGARKTTDADSDDA